MTAVEYFIKNIYDEDSKNVTKMQQVGDFIAYLNKINIPTEEKIESTIKVLDRIKAYSDKTLKQLPYTSKTTARLTYLLIEQFVEQGFLKVGDEPFVLCDLTYGYGMHLSWVTRLLKKNLLQHNQTLMAMYYDKYFDIGAYYKEIEVKIDNRDINIKVFFNEYDELVPRQNIEFDDNTFYLISDMDIIFNVTKDISTSKGIKKEMLAYSNILKNTITDNFFIIDNNVKKIIKIDKLNSTYSLMKKNKFEFNSVGIETANSINDFSINRLNITEKLKQAKKVNIQKFNIDFKDSDIEFLNVGSFDFVNFEEINWNTYSIQNIANSVFILDLPSSDIVTDDSKVSDSILASIRSYLNRLPVTQQQIFIISTAKGEKDFIDNHFFRGIIYMNGDFLPLNDNSMNLVVLSNANIPYFNIDLESKRILDLELSRIFELQKELKQKIILKDVTSKESEQLTFLKQINRKKVEELFTVLSLKEYVVIEQTLFRKTQDSFETIGNLQEVKLVDNVLEIKTDSKELVIVVIPFESDGKALYFDKNNNKVIFKKYIKSELKDEIETELSLEEISKIYKSVITTIYNEVA